MLRMASELSLIEFPPITHGPNLLPYKTVRDMILKYPPLSAGEENKKIPNHKTAGLSELNFRRIKATPQNGGGRKDWPKNLWLKCHKKKNCGHSDVYGRMKWDNPAPTMTTQFYSYGTGRFGHPRQNRALSLREGALIQTFPEDYDFYSNVEEISFQTVGRHIGNAVPVKLGAVIGKSILKHLNNVRVC